MRLTPPPGPGLDPDSASYLGAAQSLMHGSGYRVPIAQWRAADSLSTLSHFPPGYPTAIAVPMLFGARAVQAARLVNAAATFVEVALAVLLVALSAGDITGLALAAALVVMSGLVEVHLTVLSEPLYLACSLSALTAMTIAADRAEETSRQRWMWAGGFAAAAAALVRYAGLSVVGGVVIWALALPGTRAMRLRRGVSALVPALVLLGGWTTYVHLTSGVRAIRALGTYPGLRETLGMGVSTIVGWLVPLESDDVLPGRFWIALAVLAAIIWIVRRGVRAARQRSRTGPFSHSPELTVVTAAAVLGVSYVLLLIASRLLADPAIPFDERLLSPVFVLAAIIIAIAARAAWRDSGNAVRVFGAVVFVSWWIASYRATNDDVEYTLENGYDLAQTQWRASPLLAWAHDRASSRPLYSNWPSAVVLHLGRASREVPREDDMATLAQFADTLRVRNGIVLAFDWPSPDLIGVASLQKSARLHVIARLADGSVFAAAP